MHFTKMILFLCIVSMYLLDCTLSNISLINRCHLLKHLHLIQKFSLDFGMDESQMKPSLQCTEDISTIRTSNTLILPLPDYF